VFEEEMAVINPGVVDLNIKEMIGQYGEKEAIKLMNIIIKIVKRC